MTFATALYHAVHVRAIRTEFPVERGRGWSRRFTPAGRMYFEHSIRPGPRTAPDPPTLDGIEVDPPLQTRLWGTPTERQRWSPAFGEDYVPEQCLEYGVNMLHRQAHFAPVDDDKDPELRLNVEFVRWLMGYPAGWLDPEAE